MTEKTAANPASAEGRNEMPIVARRPVYGSFYGLSEPPFDLTPNPRFLFLTARQREALSNLHYGLTTPKGFTLLLGEAGTGKTTMVQAVLAGLDASLNKYVVVNNPTLERSEFFEVLTRELGLSSAARQSKTSFLAELQESVEHRFAAGGLTGIIIDEAQSLPQPLLEEIRLLGNIENARSKLLNIVLAGQPELAMRLNEPSLRQLKQRLTLRCELGALTADETAAYIAGRLRIAGGVPEDIFWQSAVIAIHAASRGIPRLINVLCDNALISGFATESKPIGSAIVDGVCRDFDLAVAPAQAAPVREPIVERSAPPPAAAPAKVPGAKPAGRAEPAREMFAGSTKPKTRFGFFSELFG